jgi:hypothetical protein
VEAYTFVVSKGIMTVIEHSNPAAYLSWETALNTRQMGEAIAPWQRFQNMNLFSS